MNFFMLGDQIVSQRMDTFCVNYGLEVLATYLFSPPNVRNLAPVTKLLYGPKMTIKYNMNKPREFKNGCFNAVIDCGYWHNRWLETALKYLPDDLVENDKGELLFTSTATRDACRIARHYCQTREIILISERILPCKNISSETDSKARYFIYVVLHEVAHAIKKHKSPLLDGLTKEESETQEKEADDLAIKWFNDHVSKRNNEHLRPITKKEIKEMKEKNQEVMKTLKNGI